jgi:hypothetical protein
VIVPVEFEPEEPERLAPIEAALIAVPTVPLDGPVEVKMGFALAIDSV